MSGDLFAHLHAFCSLCVVVVVSFLKLTFFSAINSFVVPQAMQLTHSSRCSGALNMALAGVRKSIRPVNKHTFFASNRHLEDVS